MKNTLTILWADDEANLLTPYFIYLKEKNYNVIAVNDGNEAIEVLEKESVDIIFLDENMPGLSGLETLEKIRLLGNTIPIVMITKSEEENIMEEAIGGHISDYLIKPVNPNQILLTLKKNIDHSRILSEKSAQKYQQEFRKIDMELNSRLDAEQWINLFKQITHWDIELSDSGNKQMKEILETQKADANRLFSKFIIANYEDWMSSPEEAPIMSHTVMSKKIKPLINSKEEPLFIILIDNLRWDHWCSIKEHFSDDFRIKQESLYYSILPTATQYSRNSFFCGMTPEKIQKKFPDKWMTESDNSSKNNFENDFLKDWLKRNQLNISHSYNKVLNSDFGNKLIKNISNLFSNPLNIIIYNFVDMLSHASTDVSVVKEMAYDETSYRNTVNTWLKSSSLMQMLKEIAKKKGRVIITTDHGSVQVKKPLKIKSDKTTNFNLRYKTSKSLSYDEEEVFEINDPQHAGLPSQGLNHKYIFGVNDTFFVYPNNYYEYVNLYKNTFQHGGVSLEEMAIPLIYLEAK